MKHVEISEIVVNGNNRSASTRSSTNEMHAQISVVCTQKGKNFLNKNPGIISDLAAWKKEFSPVIFSIEEEEAQQLEHVTRGSQGDIYKFKTNKEPYVYKVRLPDADAQPLDRELRQITRLENDVGGSLKAVGVTLPAFSFASSDILCRPWVEGKRIKESTNIKPRVEAAQKIVSTYIKEQQAAGDPLWKDVVPDGMYPQSPDLVHNDNFVV